MDESTMTEWWWHDWKEAVARDLDDARYTEGHAYGQNKSGKETEPER